ncbi:MAG: zf-TFIIB domain-containing protein [Bacteroidia bacterium]|nr:zf-TFIIB domain-containing protein [Bacteroidia bacterium]
MDCPICKVPLVMADKQGIEIDYCPTCRGIWLDRGELEKIIERSTQAYPPQQGNYYNESARSYENHDKHYDEHGSQGYDQYGRKKKKGLLGDLFDF